MEDLVTLRVLREALRSFLNLWFIPTGIFPIIPFFFEQINSMLKRESCFVMKLLLWCVIRAPMRVSWATSGPFYTLIFVSISSSMILSRSFSMRRGRGRG